MSCFESFYPSLRTRKSKYMRKIHILGTLLAIVTFSPLTNAAIISNQIVDAFTGGDIPMNGRTPDTLDLPGTTWLAYANGWEERVYNNVARVGASSSQQISIANSLTFTRAQTFYIAAALNLGTVGFDGHYNRGLGLGYYSGIASVSTNFTGLVLRNDGSLVLFNNGSNTGLTAGYTGLFSTTADHSLSYIINTATGALGSVLLDGQAKSFITSAFTNANTQYTGFYVSSSLGSTVGTFDNFTFGFVPEPASLSLLCGGGLMLLRRHRVV